ncbi:MAG TPA: hypothetical protein VEC99_15600 [Clostridia bacterium]|nr:hypothetical protein [Clostridia bacterium]
MNNPASAANTTPCSCSAAPAQPAAAPTAQPQTQPATQTPAAPKQNKRGPRKAKV